jgi:glycosyltransferase involved in cell wall biosynthesis
MISPFFSIIMPTYNRASFLKRSIQSVIAQSFSDWELIIVDDGSTDGTMEILQEYKKGDTRISFIFQENLKASIARNNGINHAKGKYICFLDSDDSYKPEHLAVLHDALVSSTDKNIMVCTEYDFHDEMTGIFKNVKQTLPFEINSRLDRIMSVFLPMSPPVQTICHPNLRSENILFNPLLEVAECYDYCARIAEKNNVVFIPTSTVILYAHTANVSFRRQLHGKLQFFSRQIVEFRILEQDSFYSEIANLPEFKLKIQELNMQASVLSFQVGKYADSLKYLFLYISIRPFSLFGFLFLKLKQVMNAAR